MDSAVENSAEDLPAGSNEPVSGAKLSRISIVYGAIVSLIFAVILCIWHTLDHRQPSMDEAGHILCAFSYSDLLSHAHPFKGWWWTKLLTVNNFYPPAVYAFNGLLKIFFGPDRWVDWLSLALYDFALTFSVYGTTLLLTGRRTAAIVAAVCVNFYAELIFLSHTFLLDFQVACMIAVGLFAMVWWNEKPTWKRAILTGFALALILMTKQVAGAFLAGPGLFYFARCFSDLKSGGKTRIAQLVTMALIAVVLMVPWAVASYGFISEFAETNKKVITSTVGAISVPQALQRGIRYYSFVFPDVVTPLMMALFVIGAAISGKKAHIRFLPVTLSAVLGIVMISLLPWQFPHHRYAAGALIAPAVYTGWAFSRVLNWKFLPGKIALVVVSIVAILQYFSLCFFPYPFAQPTFMVGLSDWLGAKASSMGVETRGKSTPVPFQDWGQAWVLEIIEKRDHKAPLWLNVMANHVEYNPHTFSLIAKATGSLIKPTSSRTWTVLGDTVTFSKASALYYHWYLLKTGDSGHKLLNEESRIANEGLLNFVQNSGKFEEIARRKVPDGSEILLYRQKN